MVLENYGELSDEKRMDFLKDIREESQWLIQIVENLLSITRIGDNGGSASIDKQEEMVEEIVGSAVLKFRKRYPDVEWPSGSRRIPCWCPWTASSSSRCW